MIYRLVTAFTLTLTSTFGLVAQGGDAPEASTEVVVTALVEPDQTATVSMAQVPDRYDLILHAQRQTKMVPRVAFWDAVAYCETHGDWTNGGYYAGGLGIAQSTWRGYGGWQFATSPAKATRVQQIIVANRIAFLGFQTKRQFETLTDKQNNTPFFRPAMGWRNMKNWGKNCVNWRTKRANKDYYKS